MSTPHSGQTAMAQESARDTTWIDLAQCIYGFDRDTARRLAFYRWLWETRRLGEG